MKKDKLYIGVDSELNYFKIERQPLTRGLALIGQSGCGKSFLLGRILEELVRTTGDKTQILMIDTNADFYNGLELKPENNPKGIEPVLNKYNSGLISEIVFQKFFHEENTECSMIKGRKEFDVYESYGKNRSFGFSFSWLIENFFTRFLPIIMANKSENFVFDAFMQINKKPFREKKTTWTNKIFEFSTTNTSGVPYKLPPEPFVTLYDRIKQEFFENEITDGVFNGVQSNSFDTFNDSLFISKRVAFIEIERLKNPRTKYQSILYILYLLWEKHLEMVNKIRNNEISNDEGKRTFLIIDEAHNFAPDETDDPYLKVLGEMIHKIAAEGRKYGIHLILATQRPNKLKKGLLGELDNAIIMKMNSHSDLEHLAREMRILDVKLLEPSLHFQGQGNAIAIGEMTGMAPYARLFKAAPRRTMEGGIDIEGF